MGGHRRGDPGREQGGLRNLGVQRDPRRKQGVPGDTGRDHGMEQGGCVGGCGDTGGRGEAWWTLRREQKDLRREQGGLRGLMRGTERPQE